MKTIATLMMALVVALLAGCTTKQGKLLLTPEEVKLLSSKENATLSKELCKRLITHSNELKLTPEEVQVLKMTGKVILCGKCGYLLNSKKFKDFEKDGGNLDSKTSFAEDSLRHKVLWNWTTD